jgi:uncharacterized membrane protein
MLSLASAGIAIYLTAVHYENAPLICSTRGLIDCSRVLASPYSVVPGTSVPITIPGLAWCTVSAALAVTGLRLLSSQTQHRLHLAQLTWSVLGMLTVIYLVYVELVLLHTICAWCTGLHVIVLIMLLTTIVQVQKSEDEPETSSDESLPDKVSSQL